MRSIVMATFLYAYEIKTYDTQTAFRLTWITRPIGQLYDRLTIAKNGNRNGADISQGRQVLRKLSYKYQCKSTKMKSAKEDNNMEWTGLTLMTVEDNGIQGNKIRGTR